MSRVRAAFGVELPLRALFETPTVAGVATALSAQLSGGETRPRPPLVRRESGAERRAVSFAQQRLWFLDQLAPGGSAYNIPAALRLKGKLEVETLERSLEEIVRRHEALRTSFAVNEEQQPEQVVKPVWQVKLAVEDLSELPEQEQVIAELAAAEAQRPFDLSDAPLWRARLLRLGPAEHVLLFTMHHIISDGWSLGVLVRELSTLYQAYQAGAVESPLPELTVQYGDYAEWQREWLQGAVLEEQLSYWREQLGDGGEVLELPSDRVRPAVQSYRGARQKFELEAELSESLRGLSRHEGATLFMTLLAAWQTLLWRYSGQTAISVGTPIAGRAELETESLIGFFVNTLVLRTELTGEPSFRELLKRVREVCLGAYNHQDVPFEKLVEVLQPERSLSHTPLFQVMFALQNAPMGRLELPGLELSELNPADEGLTEKFDLVLTMQEGGGAISGTLSYSTDLFERETIARLVANFTQLLTSIVTEPERSVGLLELMPAAERQQLLVEWNETASSYPREQTVTELFEAQVAQTPDAVAVVAGDEQLGYAELNRRANQVAHYLQNLGVGPETVVGICMERSLDLIVGLLGILKTGAAYLPLDPAYPLERLSFMLADGQVPVLLTQQQLLAVLPSQETQVVCVDCEWEEIATYSDHNPQVEVTPENLIYVMYTSGSTGKPKGVSITHRGVVRLVKNTNYADFNRTDVFLQLAPVSFDAATFEIWGALLNGARLVMMSAGTPSLAEIGEAIARYDVTTLWLTAGLFHLMVDEQLASLKSVGQLLAGGDVLQVSKVQQALQQLPTTRLINGYGPTENTTFTCCYNIAGGLNVETNVPIGGPISNTRVYILDDSLQPVPIGVPGELCIGGDGLARGYLNRPELTAEKFVPHPFDDGARIYRTGDLARYLSDGKIEFLGRVDNQVKIRGFRIELGEIEAVLSSHYAVREAAGIVRADVSGEKRIAAYVVADLEESRTKDILRNFLAEMLPEYMVPSVIVQLETLPLNANGKVDRHALPAPDEVSTVVTQGYVGPRSAVEEMLCGLWADVLGARQVGVEDNFFELGGHSLLATQVMSRVRAAFGVELPLRALFETPTVAGVATALSAQLSGGETRPRPPLVRRESGAERRAVSFAQQRLWFLDQLAPGGSAYNIPAALRLKGELEVETLERSLEEIVRRHEALRTSFALNEEQQPEQVVKPVWQVKLAVEDLSELPEQEPVIAELAAAEAQRPFDLSDVPLWRARLLRIGPAERDRPSRHPGGRSQRTAATVIRTAAPLVRRSVRRGERAVQHACCPAAEGQPRSRRIAGRVRHHHRAARSAAHALRSAGRVARPGHPSGRAASDARARSVRSGRGRTG
jgi:amino acid adenylation domain-containing protein